MFEKNKQEDSYKKSHIRANSLDEGIQTFGQWLYSKDNSQKWDNKFILKQFVTGSHLVLQDNTTDIGIDVIVDIADGIPICRNCCCDDCAHVGFTICVKQMNTAY